MFKSIFFGYLVLLFCVSNLHATSYYISTASSGSASGNSWTNKQLYTSFSWTKLAGGDTVYFDGGMDSLVYSSSITISSLVPTSQVIITNGIEASHNGKAVIKQITVTGCQKIKLLNLTFETLSAFPYNSQQVVYLENGSNNTLENCHIISDGTNLVLNMVRETKDTIKNCNLETLANGLTYNQDGISCYAGGGGHTITGNTVILRGTSDVPHTDLMQWDATEGGTNNYETVIANNYFSYISPTSPSQGVGGLYFEVIGSNRFLIYNNIVVLKLASPLSCLVIAPTVSTYNISARVYNNTFINGTAGGYGTWFRYLDTLIFKNNIVIDDNAGSSVLYTQSGFGAITYKDIDYNQYYINGKATRIDTSSSGTASWAQWQALGYDGHGSNTTASFANKYGANINDYKLSTGSIGIDAGTDLSKYFSTDIIGTTRPQGTAYDRGAFEYTSEVVVNNPTPTLGSLSPNTSVAGSTDMILTVTGTNFISSSVVQYNGSYLATKYVSATTLTATITTALLASAGTANITVVSPTPGGGTTSAKTFTITIVNNPAPTLTSISPTTAVAGTTDLILTITGTKFISSSVAQYNGSSLVTKYFSTTSLTSTIPTALLVSAGTANITVFNPTPGGGTSAAKTFTITAPIGGGGGTIPSATVNLTALLESYFVAGGTQMILSPWVTIELHNATAPYAFVDSNSAALSTSGIGTFTFKKVVSGTNYYLVLKSFNTVETWSATPISFPTSSISYNFTTAVNQAYTDGSNPPLALHDGKYCIYSGDLNHDGFVNSLDYAGVDNDNANLTYHLVNDLNGDGYVTSQDDQAIDNNNLLAIHKQVPAGATGSLVIINSTTK